MLVVTKPDWRIALRFLVPTLLLAIPLTAIAVKLKSNTIETELAQHTRQALTAANLPLVQISFDGRDAIVAGLPQDQAQTDAILQTIGGVNGVRTVKAETSLPTSQRNLATQHLVNPANTSKGSGDHPLEQLDLSSVGFVYAQAHLTEESLPALQQLVTLLQQYPTAQIEIAVHTDNQGTALGQMAGTQARAESILNYLVTQAIAAERLSARGYGAAQPIADNDTEEGRARNRRVEITVLQE